MERRAAEAERELVQWKKVRFMADKVGDTFEGYITGVAHFGMFVELVEHYVEGMVHVSTMADDYYRFIEQSHMLFGENTKKRYRLGDKVTVQVVRVDLERRRSTWGSKTSSRRSPATSAAGARPAARPAPRRISARERPSCAGKSSRPHVRRKSNAPDGANGRGRRSKREVQSSKFKVQSATFKDSADDGRTSSSVRPDTSTTARARWCRRSPGPIPTG